MAASVSKREKNLKLSVPAPHSAEESTSVRHHPAMKMAMIGIEFHSLNEVFCRLSSSYPQIIALQASYNSS